MPPEFFDEEGEDTEYFYILKNLHSGQIYNRTYTKEQMEIARTALKFLGLNSNEIYEFIQCSKLD